MFGLMLLVAGAYVIRHAWHWALAPAPEPEDYPSKLGIVFDGGQPITLPSWFPYHRLHDLARWAAWAHNRPCAALLECPPEPEAECRHRPIRGRWRVLAVVYAPDGSVIGGGTILPHRHA